MNLLSADKVAYILDVPKRSAYALMHAMPHYKIGGRLRVEADDLQQFILNTKVTRKVNPERSRAASALHEARRAMRNG
jgi:hypothetical protein